jgi:hypothetical protein
MMGGERQLSITVGLLVPLRRHSWAAIVVLDGVSTIAHRNRFTAKNYSADAVSEW